MQNETETQNEDEKLKESNDKVEDVEGLDLKELQDTLIDYQNSLERSFPRVSSFRPPPGFSYPDEETRQPPLTEEKQTNNEEISMVNHLPQSIATREVSLGGERKNNIMEFKDENTQAGNPVVNWTQNSDKRNYNERSFPKYKGRGRGRRDNTGTLENLKDNSDSLGLSGDARGSRWNSRDVNRSQQMMGRENTSGYKEWSRNDSGYNRPSRYPEETSRHNRTCSNDNYNADTRQPRAEFQSSPSADGVGVRAEFGSSVPVRCFICGGKDHRSAYCKNNAAMFD